MNTKETILNKIRNHPQSIVAKPVRDFTPLTFQHKIDQFIAITQSVGGDVIVTKPGEETNDLIRRHYPNAQRIASNLPQITCATENPDLYTNPRQADGVDLCVVEGVFGVLENGAIWIKQNLKFKALYFIAESLVILLRHDRLVNNMHEAYAQPGFDNYTYSTFISGPSKTADIEQALVIGAQAAKAVTVILT